MSARFVIKLLDFVCEEKQCSGKVPLVKLTRLRGYLYSTDGELTFKVCGKLNDNSKPILQVSVNGNIALCCQRCLGELAHKLDLQTTLLLVEDEVELSQYDEDDMVDAILSAPTMDVLSLIEDELILNLSISSRHQEGMCHAHTNKETSHQSNHPFAVLEKLKKLH